MADPMAAVESFGNFPIVQIAIVAVIAFSAVFGWRYGERKTKDTGSNAGTQVYFDGPIVRALDSLQGIYRLMIEVRTDLSKSDERRERWQEQQAALMREMNESLKKRVR